MGDCHEILHARRDVQELDLTMAAAGGLDGGRELAQPGGVHVGDLAEVEQKVEGAVVQSLLDRVAEEDFAFAGADAAGELEDGDDVAVLDFEAHGSGTPAEMRVRDRAYHKEEKDWRLSS
jgi:hypothetical protein